MRITLLGDLRGYVHGTPVDLGGRRQRAVLALLTIAHGEFAPSERLVDALWPTGRPADPPAFSPISPVGSTGSRPRRCSPTARVEPAAAHGLAALHGSSPDVGVAGYSLGGGMGWFARKHGLQTNHLTAVELVTADGELVRADAAHHPDLFWAIRGGAAATSGSSRRWSSTSSRSPAPTPAGWCGIGTVPPKCCRPGWRGPAAVRTRRRPRCASCSCRRSRPCPNRCRPWSNGRNYLNFTDEAADPATAYAPDTLARLVVVRDRYDPTGVFLANHPLS